MASDRGMHSSKKDNQWYFGMREHIGVDADSGLIDNVCATAGQKHDVDESDSFAPKVKAGVVCRYGLIGHKKAASPQSRSVVACSQVTMRSGRRKAPNKSTAEGILIEAAEKLKAGVRVLVEHPFKVMKRQSRHVRANYRRLKKEYRTVDDAVCLSNLRMFPSELMATQGERG